MLDFRSFRTVLLNEQSFGDDDDSPVSRKHYKTEHERYKVPGASQDPVHRDWSDDNERPEHTLETTPYFLPANKTSLYHKRTKANSKPGPNHIPDDLIGTHKTIPGGRPGQPAILVPGSLKWELSKTDRSKGRYSATFHLGDQHQSVHVGIGDVERTSGNAGKYSDEQAFIRMFHHAQQFHRAHRRLPSVEEMHQHIDRAENDTTHPLHISTADKSHFQENNNTNDLAKQTYHDFLTAAAFGVHSYLHHADVLPHIHDLSKAKIAHNGTGAGKLTAKAKAYGLTGRADTAKSDVTVEWKGPSGLVQHGLSLKRAPAQLGSPQPEEFELLLRHAADKLPNKPVRTFSNQVFSKVSSTSKNLSSLRATAHHHIDNVISALKDGDIKKSQEHIIKLFRAVNHHDNGKFAKELYHATATGEHKFEQWDHVGQRPDATHIVEMNPGHKGTKSLVRTGRGASEYIQHITKYISGNKPDYLPVARAPKKQRANAKFAVTIAAPSPNAVKEYTPSDSYASSMVGRIEDHLGLKRGTIDHSKVVHVYDSRHGRRTKLLPEALPKQFKQSKMMYFHQFDNRAERIDKLNSPVPGRRDI